MLFKHPFKNQYYVDIRRSLEGYEQCYPNQEKKTALRMVFWNFLYLFKRRKKRLGIPEDASHINMAFLTGGGYGDYLIFANWLFYFYRRYAAAQLKIMIFYHIKSAVTIFNDPIPNVELCDIHEGRFEESRYDIVIQFSKFPKLLKADKDKIERLHPALTEYIDVCERFYRNNRILLDHLPYLDGYASLKSAAHGLKRIQEPDIEGFFGIEEKYRYPLKVDEDEKAYLEKYNLTGGYITIHRGWDGTYQTNVKGWSVKSCRDLILRLKDELSSYKIVAIGSDIEQAPPDVDLCDVNLIGKTTLEQVKVLLKNAVLHIDNEGGMVHLRHALSGGPSVVLFGPTSVSLFGYSENENLVSRACDLCCEWLTESWPVNCPRSEDGVPCMEAITTDMVLEACRKLLRRGNV